MFEIPNRTSSSTGRYSSIYMQHRFSLHIHARVEYLDYSPHALARFGCFLLSNLSGSLEYTLCPSCDDLVDQARVKRFLGREAMSLKRKFTNDGHLGARDRSERNGPRCAKVDLIHAHPGVSFGTVSHDAVIARERNDGGGGEAVTINSSDGRDYVFGDTHVSIGGAGWSQPNSLGKVSK
jgi:hypothetical protein